MMTIMNQLCRNGVIVSIIIIMQDELSASIEREHRCHGTIITADNHLYNHDGIAIVTAETSVSISW